MAAYRIGQDEAYLTVREVLSETSTATDGVLSREGRVFCRCRYAILGLRMVQNGLFLSIEERIVCVALFISTIDGLG